MNGLNRLLFLVALPIACLWTAPCFGLSQGQMPVAEQNQTIQKYCAVCHTDKSMTGGLTLEHFDAAHLDPSLAAMLISKAANGAFGAAGIKAPERATQDSFYSALAAESKGATEWTMTPSQNLTQSAIFAAAVLRRAPPPPSGGDPDIYRLTLTCSPESRQGEIQLSWAPWDVPLIGGTLSAAADGKTSITYTIKNGAGAINLAAPAIGLPQQTLTIRTPRMSANQDSVNPLPDEEVVFSFSDLTPEVRRELSPCFAKAGN